MSVYGGPDIITDGLVLNIDAANIKSFDPVNTNVELLLHMDGANNSTTFTDSSKNGFTVTPNGNAKISTDQSKFGGSSAYFDGNGDYLSVANNAAFHFGSEDFTIECWVLFNDFVSEHIIVARWSGNIVSASSFEWKVKSSSSVDFNFRQNDGSTYRGASFTGLSLSASTWTHMAIVRNGNDFTLYIDGSASSSVSLPYTINDGTNDLQVGSRTFFSAISHLNGYIDELRIVKGKALYTSNFTPERKPYLDGNKIYDLSGNENNGTLVNSPTYSSDNYGVMSFDGSNDIISLPLSNSLKNTSYTISVFMNSNITIQNGTSERYFYYYRGTTTGSNRFGVLFGFSVNSTGNNGRLSLVLGNGVWNTYSTSQSSWASNTWYNLTVTQSGSSYKFYVNGLLVNSGTAVTPGFSGMDSNSSGYHWNGKIASLLVYNTALSASEVLHNYNSLKKRFEL